MTQPFQEQNDLIFLKLGGSLITEKDRPHTTRLEVLSRLAAEIASGRRANPQRSLLLGHGSGSFGHVPARKYGTRLGVKGAEGWRGFLEVWQEASELNRLVLGALAEAGVPAISFPPSAGLLAHAGQVERWDLGPLESALKAGLVPLVYGDVVFDRQRGGTIFSTEDLFDHLAPLLRPARILLAGIEPGVWTDYKEAKQLYSEITPRMLPEVISGLGGSEATDVTGGMASKVIQSLELVRRMPGLEVFIFSGLEPGLLARALGGERVGTLLRAD